ncbi:MAG: MFS transporter [Chloroflexota bacterium]|nr:MFS transporter [Chloroflexota bacterium]
MAQTHHKKEPDDAADANRTTLPRWRQVFGSLRYRDYRLVWTTSVLSSGARWIQQISLGWLVFDLTGSPVLLGSILFVFQAPSVVLSPLVGVLVDRVDRRQLLIFSQLTMAAFAVLLALDIALGYVEIWHLYIFAVISGVESTIIHVVRQALIPSVVPRESLMNAIALNSAALTSTRIFGPALAGLLIVAFGVEGNFILQAVLLTGVAIAAFPLHITPPKRESIEHTGSASLWQEIAVGLRFIWGIGTLRVLFIVQFVMMFIAMPFSNFLPVWASDVLALNADGLGLLYSAAGIGALLGTMLLATAGNVQRKGLLMFSVSVGMALALLSLGASSLLPVSLVLLGLLGATQSVFFAINMTLVQSRVPDGLQGRVMSIYNVGHAMIAMGTLTIGFIVAAWGVQNAVTGMGMAVVALVIICFVSVPSLRRA